MAKVVYNAKDPNPPVKFFFDDNAPEDGYLLLRTIPALQMDQINKKTTKKRPPEYRRGNRYEVPDEINENLRAEMMWDYMIVGWDGILDDKNKNIQCTTEKKVEFMRNWPWFAIFVGECLEQLTTDVRNPRADEIKNLPSSQTA